MNTYIVTRWEKVKSQKTIKAKSEKQALKQIEKVGFDESLDEVVSSEIEIEKESYANMHTVKGLTFDNLKKLRKEK